MQQTFLSKLHANGVSYLIGSLLLLLGVPLYQVAILNPQGYSSALAATGSDHSTIYLTWISQHTVSFLLYRLLLVVAFACLWSLPFTLFRIIIAQEILGREDEEEDYEDEEDENEEEEEGEEEDEEEQTDESVDSTGMPAEAWRGKGFAVLAAWTGLIGIVLFALATLASTIYLAIVSRGFASASAALPGGFTTLSGLFTILTYTVGGGLLGLSCLFFGVVIARAGIRLWPGLWVAFGYAALFLTAFLISSAIGVATVSNESQSIFTTPAILLFALWTFWFGLMLVRLKPEPA